MNGFGSELRIMISEGFRSGSKSFKFRLAAGLLLIAALALLPGAALSEADPDDAGEVEATTDASIWDTSSEADPDLIEAGTPAGEPPLPEHGGIEEIMVTAQKRSTNIQETPTAITALSGAQLFDRGIYDVESLATQVPNFQYGESFGISRITIRGIGNQGFTDPSTPFHIDGVYQNNPTAASALTFYDLSQVEVLRGPQGVLWGRNSTAGAINVATRAPTDEFEVFGDVLRGSYNQWSGRGVVNVPLFERDEGTVAARVAGYFDQREGYQQNLFYPGHDQDANDADNWGIRPQFSIPVTDDLNLILRGSYNHQGGVGWGNRIVGSYPGPWYFGPVPELAPPLDFLSGLPIWVDPYTTDLDPLNPDPQIMQPNPTDPREVRKNTIQFQDISTWDAGGELDWEISDSIGFNLVGSYKEESRAQNFDGDDTEQQIVTANITASTTDLVFDMHLKSLEDVQLGEKASLEWLVGLFVLDAKGQLYLGLPGSDYLVSGSMSLPNSCVLFSGQCIPTGTINLLNGYVSGSNKTLSFAPYAHLGFKLMEEKVRISLGLRVNYDKKTSTRISGQVNAATSLDPAPGSCVQRPYPPPGENPKLTADWTGVTGETKVELLPTDSNMAYLSVARAFKPGYINGYAATTGCDEPLVRLNNAKEETAWAYEIGSKNRFFDDTVQANFTAFLYQYDNLQVSSQFNNTGYIQNAAKAQVRGLEFEGIWEPVEDLSLSVVYGYLNARYLDYRGFDFSTGASDDPDGLSNFSGNRMVRSPKHTATIAATYLWDLGENGSIIPRIQYFVSDSIYFDAANSPASEEPSYGNLQIRTRWQNEDDSLFIEGFVENVTDEDVRSTRSIGGSLLGRPIYGAFEPPRTWGVRVGASY